MDEYVRYGEEWKKEMMRNKKEDIVRMFSDAMKEKEEYAEQACKKQKEICQQHFLDTKGYEDIKSAPLATDK